MIMQKTILVILISFLMVGNVHAGKIIPHADLTYLGVWSMPHTTETDACFQWDRIDGNLEYNPDGDVGGGGDGYPGSLIVVGKVGCPTIGEISIPAPKTSYATLADLNHATELQAMTNIGNGDINDGLPDGGDITKVGVGDVVIMEASTGNRLLMVTHKGYTTGDRAELFSSADLDFSTSVGFTGWYKFNGSYVTEYQHYLFRVPQAWADTYTSGRSVIAGCNRHSLDGSYGATMYAFMPWEADETPPAASTLLDYTQLVSYGTDHMMDNYAFSNMPSDMVWVNSGTKNAIIANGMWFGRWRTTAPSDAIVTTDWTATVNGVYYGNRHPEGAGSKGFHAEPYSQTLLFYDPDDLAAVALGTKQPYEVQPYAYWDMSQHFIDYPFHKSNSQRKTSGIAYDSTNGFLYVVESAETDQTGGRTLVHVYEVDDSVTTTLDTTAPTDPTSLTLSGISETSVTLSWTGSTDAAGNGVEYVIYLNGYPVLRTPNTTYTYTYTDDWMAGDPTVVGWPQVFDFEFQIFAEDKYHNLSGGSNTASASFGDTVTLTGTLNDSTEAELAAANKTIIWTVDGDTWVDDVCSANRLATACDGSLATATSFDTAASEASCVRDSDTQVTQTITAPTYDIDQTEQLTCTAPAASLTGGAQILATPTLTISYVSAGAVNKPTISHSASGGVASQSTTGAVIQ